MSRYKNTHVSLYTLNSNFETESDGVERKRHRVQRMLVFALVFLAVAGTGLVYDYSRPAVYRATARLAVEHPGTSEDPVARAQFAVSESQALRRTELIQGVAEALKDSLGSNAPRVEELDRRLSVEAVPQTSVIELRAEGHDRSMLVAALGSWIDLYSRSRKDTDRQDESEAIDEARHQLKVAQKAVEDKRKEMDQFRQRHGIISVERDENPGTARLKGLHGALNDAATREVNAEAKLKAINNNLTDGKGVVRAADKNAISALEMRAVDLRERLKDLEHDYTAQYLAMDPKYKALRANLSRVEQQVEQEKDRSQKAALIEAQEEYASAQRAAQKLREQVEAIKQESQSFSTRFVELRRMGTELEQLQETRRIAVDRVAKLQSARKPAAVKVRVLSAPLAAEEPVSPNYTRDAGIALGGGLVLALGAVLIMDFLRRDPQNQPAASNQPVIQIAYPVLPTQAAAPGARIAAAGPSLLPAVGLPNARELAPPDVASLWRTANADQRLLIAGLFSGLAPEEWFTLRWSDVDLDHDIIRVNGSSARHLPIGEPLGEELKSAQKRRTELEGSDTIVLKGFGSGPIDMGELDTQLAFLAHDAGLSHPEDVTAGALHFTYCAFLARQGIRMTDLVATIGRVAETMGAALMRLAPPGQPVAAHKVERAYPGLRA